MNIFYINAVSFYFQISVWCSEQKPDSYRTKQVAVGRNSEVDLRNPDMG